MAGRFTLPTPSAYDSSGNPLAGGQLFFYESGTTTPLDTYSDDDLTTANANPVVADSAGRWGDIFLKDQDYKVILQDADDVTIDTWDPVRAAEPTSTATRAISTTDTMVASDNGKLILADATGGGFTYTLLPAATAGDGFTVYVKKVDSSANAVTVDADGSEAIDGDTDVSLPSQWDVAGLRCNGTAWRMIVQPLTADRIPFPQGYISGLEISNNGTDSEHDVDIAAGVARDEGDEANMILASAITKRLDAAWAVGDGNGGLDTGSIANATVYYGWLIQRSDTGVVDVLFSASPTAPTMPSNYDLKRRLRRQVLTDSSANIVNGISGTGYAGSVVQTAHHQTGAVATGTTTVPLDDTIPQNTEGDQYMALTIAPTNADNVLEITAILCVSHSTSITIAAALFQDSTADALAVVAEQHANGVHFHLVLRHRMLAGTTSATTFKIRAGGSVAGTTTLNGVGGSRQYGGVLASSLTVTELTA